jgi:uncharacterized membrane protein YdbT with pleckstrin-like domain
LPKALLPVANKPLLSYVLEMLEANNLKNIIVVIFLFTFFIFFYASTWLLFWYSNVLYGKVISEFLNGIIQSWPTTDKCMCNSSCFIVGYAALDN